MKADSGPARKAPRAAARRPMVMRVGFRWKEVPTLEEFAPRFLDGYARANRQPSGIAAKETIGQVRLLPLRGGRRLDEITTEDIQRLKHNLALRRRVWWRL